MNYLVNIILGFTIAQLIEILNRNKDSESSPTKFSIKFFFNDNWLKISVSLLLSVSIGTFLNFNNIDLSIFLSDFGINVTPEVLFFIIGFSPEIILQILKKTYGFLQPTTVETNTEKFVRRNINTNINTK